MNSNKLTKIVATIGPSSDSEEMIGKLLDAGVNVFRFNLKHAELAWHKERIERVKKVSEEKEIPAATLIDLQGPEIRIIIPDGSFEIKKGEKIVLAKEAGSTLPVAGGDTVHTTSHEQQPNKLFTISHPDIIPHLEVGTEIFVEDGKFSFIITEKKEDALVLVSDSKGVLQTKKSMNIPGVYFPLPVLGPRDLSALDMAGDAEVDFVALSFVRKKEDVDTLRSEMEARNLTAKIVSKIETKLAIDAIDSILEVSDEIMVARGDLGIELPIEEVPYYQKVIIKKCIEATVPVITATQMLETMIDDPYPTRAEVSDVANAVYDFTDSVMLSGETAQGKYPLRVIETMSKILAFTEKKNTVDSRGIFLYPIEDQEDVICDTAYNLSFQFPGEVGGFVLFSQNGKTARKLAHYHPEVPIYTFVPEESTARSLLVCYGVIPLTQKSIFQKERQITKEDILAALLYLKEAGFYDPKKYYILLHGDVWMTEGKTSTIKIIAPAG